MLKTERVGLILTGREKQALQTIAQTEEESAAAVVRRLIRQEAQRRGLWPTPSASAQPTEGVRA